MGSSNNSSPGFSWIPLGAQGGLDESDLSAHLVAPVGSPDLVCCDAGTLYAGLRVACRRGCFSELELRREERLSDEGVILRNHIKAYLISHPYLDHTAGLAEASPTDSPKPILALAGVIADLEHHLFNWRTWPNFADRGVEPALGLYRYVTLSPGERTAIPGTELHVEALPLSHGGTGGHTDSTAFLLDAGGAYALYMGDTGPDEIEGRDTTAAVWRRITPLVRERRLRDISIECSYTNERPDDQLFSHLTPRWLITAFRQLAELVDPGRPEEALHGLSVIITHIKPNLDSGPSPRDVVAGQLAPLHELGVQVILAEQGKQYLV